MLTRKEYISRPVEIERELLTLFRKDDRLVIFDIGACEAEDSIRYSMLFPSSTVYAFEPREDNCRVARNLVSEYGRKNIILEPLALSDANGTAEFFVSEGEPGELKNDDNWNYGNKSSSLLPPAEEMKKHTAWLEFKRSITVRTMRLDDYMKLHNLGTIDFAHIDVQGAEMLVFRGAGKFLEKIKVIWTEVEAVKLYKDQPVKSDIESYMRSNGFVNIYDTVGEVSGDQLYVNTAFFTSKQIRSLRRNKGILTRIKSFFISGG